MVFYRKNDMPLLLFGRKPIVAGDPKKIEMGLKAKGIPSEVFHPFIEDIQKPLLIEKIQLLIDRKVKSIKGETPSDRKQKLIRFLLGKGFAYDLIKEAIGARSF
jgi:regulatory protein